MSYRVRALDQRLDYLAQYFTAIAIEGPKAVGKTETALRRVGEVFRMDSADDRDRFLATDLLSKTEQNPILIDEWQLLPESWDIVRRTVDAGAPPGSIFLTGSATPAPGVTTHTGAGRIMTARLRPFGLCETTPEEDAISLGDLLTGETQIEAEATFTLDDYIRELATTGLPAASALPSHAQSDFLSGYVQRIVDRELPAQGYTVRNRQGLLSWLRAYARATGTDASYTQLLARATAGDGNAPSKRTTAVYREKLSEIWMVDPLPAWDSLFHLIPRQTVAPKHYLADVALSLYFAGIRPRQLNTSQNASRFGQFFESFAVHSARVAGSAHGLKASHVRTKGGEREIDLVLESRDGAVLAFEMKLAGRIRDEDVRHLTWLRDQLGEDLVEAVVLYTGRYAYRRPDGVAVIPLSLLRA
ncbi:ATP-binding protein [Corynebacterium cystitidis]|uniref:ATP-binding protein n=1 Tax=Corynebacterium cystitidis TaxID=35757 RepID=UPI001E491B2D|nr:DUF4143 domain-containing protein [Corynebacterium cystitidis]